MKVFRIDRKITNIEISSFKQYLKEIKVIPMLTPDEETELAFKAINGDEKAASELVLKNLRFVVSVAKKYATDKIYLEDLVNEGNIGLITAVQKYDPTKGLKFISFAVWWVRKAILIYLSNNGKTVRIPINRVNELARINKQALLIEQKTCHKVDISELYSHFSNEMSEQDFNVLNSLNNFNIDSLDREINSDDGNSLPISELMSNENDDKTDFLLEKKDLKNEINLILSTLKPRDKKIIEMLFGLNGYQVMTLQEVGDNVGLTREMVRQIKNKNLDIFSKNKRIQLVAQS